MNNCSPNSKCSSKCGIIVGSIFLIIATVLTLLTHSDAGIFGMFLVGLGFCVCHHFGGCKTCACCGCCSCCCKCDCCATDTQCNISTNKMPSASVTTAATVKPVRKKTTIKKTI